MRQLIFAAVAFSTLVSPLTSAVKSRPIATLPKPILHFTGAENYDANGMHWVRYRYDVINKSKYPGAMFAAAPDLPPCGLNTQASRTWVDFFDSTGKRLYGFCALRNPSELGSIWFSSEADAVPPSRVYIEITDRLTATKYKSNLATTKGAPKDSREPKKDL